MVDYNIGVYGVFYVKRDFIVGGRINMMENYILVIEEINREGNLIR